MADIVNLMKRYNISKQAACKYIRGHLDQINADGEHAIRRSGVWYFDDMAIERIDQLRGHGQVAGVMEKVESDKVLALEQLVSNLQAGLLQSNRELIESQRAQLAAMKELGEVKALLAAAPKPAIDIEKKLEETEIALANMQQFSGWTITGFPVRSAISTIRSPRTICTAVNRYSSTSLSFFIISSNIHSGVVISSSRSR